MPPNGPAVYIQYSGPNAPRAPGPIARVRGTFVHSMRDGLALILTGDNLLGQQLGEPDNVTILPGRTITAGLRARF